MTSKLSYLGLSLALAAGCGGAPSNGYNSPVATFSGTITSAVITTPQDLHVALVWDHFTSKNGELKSAQEVGVRAQFPVHFQIDVATPPPEEAMNRVPTTDASEAGFDPSSFRYALGTVLVYEDDNGNGKLDLLPLDATSYVDQPLGAAKAWIVYIEGTPPPVETFGGAALAAGFNLVTDLDADCPNDGSDICSPSLQVLPLSTDLEIALTADPKLAGLLCQFGGGATSGEGSASNGSSSAPPSTGGSGSSGSSGATPFTPPPAGAKITCSSDNRSFTSELCSQVTLCADTICDYGSSMLAATDPVPAGWPCPVSGS